MPYLSEQFATLIDVKDDTGCTFGTYTTEWAKDFRIISSFATKSDESIDNRDLIKIRFGDGSLLELLSKNETINIKIFDPTNYAKKFLKIANESTLINATYEHHSDIIYATKKNDITHIYFIDLSLVVIDGDRMFSIKSEDVANHLTRGENHDQGK